MGLAVDVPASTVYVTGMGGTTFTGDTAGAVTCNSQGQNCSAASDPPYWNGSTSVSDTSSTALEYIPETAWNDSAAQDHLSDRRRRQHAFQLSLPGKPVPAFPPMASAMCPTSRLAPRRITTAT